MSLLSVRGLTIEFGGVHALDEVDIDVERNSICGLIGPNGAGKTTLFNCLSRIYQPSLGSVTFDGSDLLACTPESLSGRGIARTFQNLGLFPTLTVLENVMTGGYCRWKPRLLDSAVSLPSSRRLERECGDRAHVVLEQLGLDQLAKANVEDLPFGTMKRIELARALMSRPSFLMLDEPANGLPRAEVSDLARLILQLREEYALTILLVEHHMGLVMEVSDALVAMESGAVIASGEPAAVRNSPEVVRAYLGQSA